MTFPIKKHIARTFVAAATAFSAPAFVEMTANTVPQAHAQRGGGSSDGGCGGCGGGGNGGGGSPSSPSSGSSGGGESRQPNACAIILDHGNNNIYDGRIVFYTDGTSKPATAIYDFAVSTPLPRVAHRSDISDKFLCERDVRTQALERIDRWTTGARYTR